MEMYNYKIFGYARTFNGKRTSIYDILMVRNVLKKYT